MREFQRVHFPPLFHLPISPYTLLKKSQSEYDDHAARVAARESSKGKDPIATIKVTVEALRKLQASKNKAYWLLTRRPAPEKRKEVDTEPKKNNRTTVDVNPKRRKPMMMEETTINNTFDPFAFVVNSSCDTEQS